MTSYIYNKFQNISFHNNDFVVYLIKKKKEVHTVKGLKMFIAFTLIFSFIFAICSPTVSASEISLPNYDSIGCSNGTIRRTENGVSFNISSEGAAIYWPISKDDIFPDANTLAIALSNYSLCEAVNVELLYSDGSSSVHVIELEQYSTMKTYTFSADDCDNLIAVNMSFDGVSSGEIIFYYICAVSFFNEDIENIGEISVCSYNDGIVTLKGTLRHDAVIKYSDSQINIYALGPGQSVTDILSGTVEPVMTGGAMSIRFEFSLRTGSDFARLKKYVAAAVDESGIVVIDSPRYPEVDVPQNKLEFKGIESSVVFGTVETGAGLSVVDIDMSELVSSGNNGYMYTLDENRYFFDRSYVEGIDSKISVLDGAGSKVYLRILGAQMLLNEETQQKFYATVRFLCARYSSFESGRIFGIIIGESVNQNIPEGTTLARYSLASYDTLYTVFAAANDAGNPVDAVFSVSKSWGRRPTDIAVPSDIYLDALFSVCGYYSESRFGVIAEIDNNPYSLDDDYISQLGSTGQTQGGTKLKKADPDCDYISSENIARFYRAFEKLSEKHLGKVPDLIYSWRPAENTSGTALTAAYVYNYYKLFFSRYVSSFVVNLKGDEGMQVQTVNELKYKMKYIDTEKSSEIGDFAREIFGIDDWKSEILSFKADALKTRIVKDSLKLGSGVPSDVIGKYEYWNFRTQSSYNGWQAGLGCSSVYLENNSSDGRALNASFVPDASYSGYDFFSYVYEHEENFRYNDYLLIDLMINSSDSGHFEVNITLGGSGFSYEYRSSDIVPGNKYTLSIDISELTENNTVEYIRIGTKNLAAEPASYSVSLHSVSAASRIYNDDVLRENIIAERDRIQENGNNETEEAPKTVWMVIVGGIVLVTAVVMIMIDRSKKSARSEDRARD